MKLRVFYIVTSEDVRFMCMWVGGCLGGWTGDYNVCVVRNTCINMSCRWEKDNMMIEHNIMSGSFSLMVCFVLVYLWMVTFDGHGETMDNDGCVSNL